MFYRQKRPNVNDPEKQREYEYAIERMYTHKRIGLAIAGMRYFDACTSRKDILERR
jgi:hypothetical protein